MPTIKMSVLSRDPDPGSKSVMVPMFDGPVISGSGAGAGDASYACGKCGAILIENVAAGSVSDVVIKCHACGKFNEVSTAN